MGSAVDREAHAVVTVDFGQRRRVNSEQDDSSTSTSAPYEDTGALESVSLIDRITGGAATAPQAPPEQPEADEFFEELKAQQLALPPAAEPVESDQLDPWIEEQARPRPAIPASRDGSPNGTADLALDVRTTRPARPAKALRRPKLPRLKSARRSALRLGVASCAGTGVLVIAALALGNGNAGRASAPPPAAVASLQIPAAIVDQPARAAQAFQSRVHRAAIAAERRAHNAARRAHHQKAAHPTVVAQHASSSSSPPPAVHQPAVNYAPVTSGSSSTSAASSSSGNSAPTQPAPPAGPSGGSSVLGAGHCSC
jgi:hypothetical protein